MRASAIFGPGSSQQDLNPFQLGRDIEWSFEISPEVNAVLIFGGDGTIHRNLRTVSELQLPLLVVPRGSGNDFARALGIRGLGDSLPAWREFCRKSTNVRTIDLGMITAAGERSALHETLFCCVACVGLDAEVAEAANRLPRWLRAHGGYLLSLLGVLPKFAPLQIRISKNESGTWEACNSGLMMLSAFANTSVYGGGIKIAPQARIDDGKLDACLIRGTNSLGAVCVFPAVYFGKHLSISKVDYFQLTRARIETERPLKVYADGEFVCTTPAEISIRPQALQVIVPVLRT